MVRHSAVAPVKGRIEAGDLRQFGKPRAQGADRREVVGLMQRRERPEAREFGEHLFVDHDRPVVLRTAVNNPMTDRDQAPNSAFPASTLPRSACAVATSGTLSRSNTLIHQSRHCRPPSARKLRTRTDAIESAL